MRVEKFGRTRYALGLTWIPIERDQTPGEALEWVEADDQPIHFVVTKNEDQASIGYAVGKLPKVASYAAELASVAPSGIYVASLPDGHWWYCVISDGVVVPNTDRILSHAEVLESVEQMRMNFGLELYSFGELQRGLPAQAFLPDEAVAKAARKWLKRQGLKPAEVLAPIFALGVLGLAVWGGYTMFLKKDASSEPSPEEIRAQYLTTLRGALPQLPAQVTWPTQALRAARDAFPVYADGWALDIVECSVGSCVATYTPVKGGMWRSVRRFEELGLKPELADPSGKALRVAVAAEGALLAPTDDELLDFPTLGAPLPELVGVFPLRFAGVQVQDPQQTAITADGVPAPPEAKPLKLERVVLASNAVLDQMRLRAVTAFWADHAFRVARIRASFGYGESPSGWKIEMVRVRGG